MVQIMFLGCKNFNNETKGSTIPSQSNNSTRGLIMSFEKLESSINVDIQFSFSNVHYKTTSVPLGTQRLNEKEMTITCHMRLLHKTVPCIPCFPQVYSFNFVRVISWDSHTLLQMMSEHFPACVRPLNSVKSR